MNATAEQHGGNGDGRPSLLIADDDAAVRSALSAQLEGDFRVVGVAMDASEAIELAGEHRPDDEDRGGRPGPVRLQVPHRSGFRRRLGPSSAWA